MTAAPVLAVVVWHLGRLHPLEHVLVYLLAFGPFVLLAVTIRVGRRRDRSADLADGPGEHSPER
jgi:hypothetical protein